jgi:AcrR family transcriptional regulator
VNDPARRLGLLRRLESLVLCEGFSTLTADDLAAHLHCSKSTLYGLASTKEQIIVDVIGQFLDRAGQRAHWCMAASLGPGPRLRAYLESFGQSFAVISARCRADIRDHDATRSAYEVTVDGIRTRLGDLIREGIDAGAFRSVHAGFVAAAAALLVDRYRHDVHGPLTTVADFLLDSLAP